MPLFDEIPRDQMEPGQFGESPFGFLNRSARPGFAYIRSYLEEWFSRFPLQHSNELRARFRSRLEATHGAAFFELLLHELLLRHSYRVTVHPPAPHRTTSPDFLADRGQQHRFFLEATVATYQSATEVGSEALVNRLYDYLNNTVNATNFFLSVEIKTRGATPPPARRISQFLNESLSRLDPDSIHKQYEHGGWQAIPQLRFEEGGWSFEFVPMPKKGPARGKPRSRPLGMFPSGWQSVDHRTPLRDAILDKVGRYGELGAPYLVAVSARELIDEIDVMEALFGKEKVIVQFSEQPPAGPVAAELSRDLDGVWTSPSGPKNTRLTAVLVGLRLTPWSLGEADVRVYHNPWARFPLPDVLDRLPRAIPQGQRMNNTPGSTLPDVLGLPWPPPGAA